MKNTKKKGFTLIELIVVIAILGILAAVLIPRFTGFQDKARGTQALVDAKSIATAIDGFNAESNTGAWPVEGTDDGTILTTAMGSTSATAEGNLHMAANGGFVWVVNGTGYIAGRHDSADDVHMYNATAAAVTVPTP